MSTATRPLIDYYFSVISPWTYLGDGRFQELAQRFDAQVIYHPLSSADLFPATGGQLLKDRAKPRKDYRLVELARWKKHLGVPLNVQPKHFPVSEAPASKLLLATQSSGQDAGPLLSAILKAVWAEERDISDVDTLIALAGLCGLDVETLFRTAQSPEYDAAFSTCTQMAIQRGVFGYPTYALNNELFWGQDRLPFLESALTANGA